MERRPIAIKSLNSQLSVGACHSGIDRHLISPHPASNLFEEILRDVPPFQFVSANFAIVSLLFLNLEVSAAAAAVAFLLESIPPSINPLISELNNLANILQRESLPSGIAARGSEFVRKLLIDIDNCKQPHRRLLAIFRPILELFGREAALGSYIMTEQETKMLDTLLGHLKLHGEVLKQKLASISEPTARILTGSSFIRAVEGTPKNHDNDHDPKPTRGLGMGDNTSPLSTASASPNASGPELESPERPGRHMFRRRPRAFDSNRSSLSIERMDNTSHPGSFNWASAGTDTSFAFGSGPQSGFRLSTESRLNLLARGPKAGPPSSMSSRLRPLPPPAVEPKGKEDSGMSTAPGIEAVATLENLSELSYGGESPVYPISLFTPRGYIYYSLTGR